MSRFLAAMVDGVRSRVEEARRRRSLAEVEEAARSLPAPRRIGSAGFQVFAEIKPRSPARGRLPHRDPVAQAIAYSTGGAAALSLLTEPDAFGGSLSLLQLVAGVSPVPVMAKDFVVDPYQVFQARTAGADGVLLIARLLDADALPAVLEAVDDLGMFALLEAFDQTDLARLGPHTGGPHLLGVNCRDLDTLEMVPERHLLLAPLLPDTAVAIAESGVSHPEEAARLAGAGYRGVLVGSALMESGDPAGLVASLLEAGQREGVTDS